MSSRILIFLIAVFLLFSMAVYFVVNPSYGKSMQARYYYGLGDYKEALTLAKESFSIDIYNRMASTIMAQSITALKYVSYIEMAEKYMKDINDIATHEEISNADKAKIRLICGIMISSYVKLAPSVITDEDLVIQSAEYYNSFEKLLEKVNR